MHVYITSTGEAVGVHQQTTSMVGSHVLPHHDQSVLNPSVLMSSIPIESSVSDSFVSAASSGSVPNTRADGEELPANSVSSHEHEAVTPTRPSEQESVSTLGRPSHELSTPHRPSESTRIADSPRSSRHFNRPSPTISVSTHAIQYL